MKKIIIYLSILGMLCFGGCGQTQKDVEESVGKDTETITKDAEINEEANESTQEPEKEAEGGIVLSIQGWEIINRIEDNLPEGYEEVQLSYMNASDLGWYCYEEMWSSKEEREALAQAALKELYTFTGNNLTGCIYYCTNGCSSFAFGGSPEDMQNGKYIYCRNYGTELAEKEIPSMSWRKATPMPLENLLGDKIADGEPQSHLEEVLLQVLGQSGLYQEQKIDVCKVVYPGLEEESYFHLEFAEGYYEIVTDKKVESLIRISGPHFYEEEKALPIPAYMTDITDEVYRNLITELIETDMPLRGWWPYATSYVILDIDEDGREELILNGANASAMATMAYHIYDYDRNTGEVFLEFACWPDVDFLDNGYVTEEASHNHGRSDLDDFWPYHLLVYNEETDQYETVAQIDAWQKELYPKDFPDDADKDGDGIVYYTADNQFWSPTAFMDKAEYEIWCEQYNKGTAKKIQWKAIMTWEDYVAIYLKDAVG